MRASITYGLTSPSTRQLKLSKKALASSCSHLANALLYCRRLHFDFKVDKIRCDEKLLQTSCTLSWKRWSSNHLWFVHILEPMQIIAEAHSRMMKSSPSLSHTCVQNAKFFISELLYFFSIFGLLWLLSISVEELIQSHRAEQQKNFFDFCNICNYLFFDRRKEKPFYKMNVQIHSCSVRTHPQSMHCATHRKMYRCTFSRVSVITREFPPKFCGNRGIFNYLRAIAFMICVCVFVFGVVGLYQSFLRLVGLRISIQLLLAGHFILSIIRKGFLRYVQYVPLWIATAKGTIRKMLMRGAESISIYSTNETLIFKLIDLSVLHDA